VGLPMGVKREWTEAEIKQLTALTKAASGLHEVARKLHRASDSVRAKQIEIGLVDAAKLRRYWTADDLAIIRECYADTPTADLAKRLGRHIYSIYNAAEKLGLSKSEEFMASPAACRLRRGDNVGAEFRFKKGIVPHNKGRKTPGVSPGRMAETQFSKGSVPRNWRPIGSLRYCDGYLQRKMTDTGYPPFDWRPEHHVIWVAANGELPADHILIFKDGNRSHVVLDNLELITRAELARRNSIHNLPEDLKEVIRLNGSIKRRVRRILREKQNDGSTQSLIRNAGNVEVPRQADGDRAGSCDQPSSVSAC
jgi:hypothetical protein